LKLKTTILDVAGINYNQKNYQEVFRENIKEIKKNGFRYYLTPDNLYIFEFQGRGLWGIIKGVISLSPDLKTIGNLRIISQEETPGLGGRISEKSFLAQFKKKKVIPKLILALRRKATKFNEVDAITGATITSKALINMINEAVANFHKLIKE
jgi:Na+-transporting NADH:ubiquinone oxidoreductase subunit C